MSQATTDLIQSCGIMMLSVTLLIHMMTGVR